MPPLLTRMSHHVPSGLVPLERTFGGYSILNESVAGSFLL